MLKEILEAITGKGMLGEMCNEFIGMLDITHEMLEKCQRIFTGELPADERTGTELHDTDVKVNQAERRIRKQIVRHLSVEARDIPLCLILMSTTKDVERIGDICKNLHETAQWLGDPLAQQEDEHAPRLMRLFEDLNESYPKVVQTFKKSEKQLGHEVLEMETEFSDRCDDMIEELADDELPTRKAVCYTLLARYAKRINAHLSNVASAVVMPLHKLDFFDEKWQRPEEGAEEEQQQ